MGWYWVVVCLNLGETRWLSLLMSRKSAIYSAAAIEEPLDPAAIECIPHGCCSLWGGERRQLYFSSTDWASLVPGNREIRGCPADGVARLVPQPVAEDIPKRNPSGYYTHHATARTRFERLHPAILQRALAQMGYPVEPAEALLPPWLSRLWASARAAVLEVMSLWAPKSEPYSMGEAETASSSYECRPGPGAVVAPYFFQLLQDALVRLKPGAGERDSLLVRYAVNS